MKKITDFNGINKYFCIKCQCFHNKYRFEYVNGKREKKETNSYINHKEFARKLLSSELFNLQFKRTWKRYNKKEHKKTYGSRKQ